MKHVYDAAKFQKQKPEDLELHVCSVMDLECSSKLSSFSGNMTGDTRVIGNIDDLGCDPDQWLNLLEQYLKLDETPNKSRLLKHLFFRAKEVIDLEKNKRSRSFSKILAHEAVHIGANNVDDARDAFKFAALNLRRVPFIHIAFAQFELDQGRRDKALKALQLGKMVIPLNEEINEALLKLSKGGNELISRTPSPLNNITNMESKKKIRKTDDCHKPATTNRAKISVMQPTTPSPPTDMSNTHTISEALDLPCSPCTPDLNRLTKPGLITPDFLHKRNNHSNKSLTLTSLKTPTPPRMSYSVTKSIPNHLKFQHGNPPSSMLSIKSQDHSTTKPSNGFGRARRIPCSMRRGHGDSDDELDGVTPLHGEIAQQRPKPQVHHEDRQPESRETITNRSSSHHDKENMIPPHELPQRLPRKHSTEEELLEWLGKSKILKIQQKTYIVLKVLGVGGSSKVYEVLDISSKSIKAVKQVKLNGCDDSVKEGFLNEIKFLQKLKDSPNIIHLHDYELTDDHLYIVMECGSIDLSKLLQQNRLNNVNLETCEIRSFWKKMLAAVKTIHDHGVIHLDLKPANFILMKGNLKLIDFGIANSIQADATSVIKDTQFGTLNYMAPEAIMDMSGGFHNNAPKFKISPRADVWSLGCILYLMMFGKTPFQHITHQLMKLNAITNPAYRIEFGEFSDKQMLQIVQNCLIRDPKKRPTVKELLEYS